jgi:nucleoside-diphosphate-sugar epimerase
MLLTGKTGFLGEIISDALTNYEIDGLGVRPNNEIRCDLSSNIPDITKKYDLVVHAAAKAHDLSPKRSRNKEFFDVNYNGTINLTKGIEKSGFFPDQFVFISTVSVYGVDNGEAIGEDFPLNGKSPYAKSKILAEQWIQNWSNKHKVNLIILRLPLVVGRDAPGNLRALINGIKTGRYFSIGRADAHKSMVWAEDIAKLIPELLNKNGVFNLTDGDHPTIGQIEDIVSAAFNKRKPIKVSLKVAKVIGSIGDLIPGFPFNSDKLLKLNSNLTFDDKKARELLNWKPSKVIDNLSEIL